jgi:hypothetical protein
VTLRLASGDLVVADMRARSPAVLPGQVLRLAPAAAPAIVPR